MQKAILLNTFGERILVLKFHQLDNFSEFDADSTILIQIKVLGGKINGTTLE